MSQSDFNLVLMALAVIWPILVRAMDRSKNNGSLDEKIARIERDVAEIRAMFVLTPAYIQTRKRKSTAQRKVK